VQRIFISDCEGPISKNDNAFELTAKFVPNGDKLFSIISKYDDVLADVVKKPGYNAGDTLKLILPFLKAYNLTDKQVEEFSKKTLILILGSKETLRYIETLAPAYIVSTSYEHYIRALCDLVGFDFEHTYCTRLSLDKYRLTSQEKALLKQLAKEISNMSIITIPAGATSTEEFSDGDKATLCRLNEIFWKQFPSLTAGKMISDVTAIGGRQKAQAIQDATSKLGVPISSVMYVGDSITDVEAFQLTKKNGGLAVSFNGNSYAVRSAEVVIIAENNIIIALLADVFLNHGKEESLKLVKTWSVQAIKNSGASIVVQSRFFETYPAALPKVQIVTDQNMETLTKESSIFRKQVRGGEVGKLG
jgi:energy-converting hydrogenase A subunit R